MTAKTRQFPVPYESGEQEALVQWLNLAALTRPELDNYFMIPNGAYTSPREGGASQKNGITARRPRSYVGRSEGEVSRATTGAQAAEGRARRSASAGLGGEAKGAGILSLLRLWLARSGKGDRNVFKTITINGKAGRYMAVKKAVKGEAVTVKTLAAELCRQFDLIAELRADLEATRDEVEFIKSDIDFIRSDVDDVQAVQAKTKTNNKRRVRNGKAKSVR